MDNFDSVEIVKTAKKNAPRFFAPVIFGCFAWIIIGICIIYGIRLYFNSAINSSFFPIVGAVFSAALSFTLVLTLEYATGAIKIHILSISFEGASGPIILWCLCFFVITYGLHLLGMQDATKALAAGDNRTLLELMGLR